MGKNNVLGGFEAILDNFIPSVPGQDPVEIDEPIDDDDLENIKKNQYNPPVGGKKTTEPDVKPDDDDEPIDEPIDEPQNVKNNTKPVEPDVIDEPADEINEEIVTGFFDTLAENLGWEFDENEEKPKSAEELVQYFQDIIEQESKPSYASEEIEALDNFVKQGGDLRKYLQIDAQVDLEDIDMEDEHNLKTLVKMLLREKNFNAKQIDKKIAKYEEAGLLEEEATDALEELKEIREIKKQQLLKEQKKQYDAYRMQQQLYYDNVVEGIKSLKDIRGIAVPEKDKRALINYILKPEADGKTRYQKDYVKGGIKNLIESAYFTMNADKLIESAKREGNNRAIDKFKNSLKTNSISGKSRSQGREKSDESIWSSIARSIRS